ncbi:MAG: DciA family protein [Weeksellaceae bacterium]|jgi:hypothetical protein|nr:DciA family protein [Weeksellaceae bacterium]
MKKQNLLNLGEAIKQVYAELGIEEKILTVKAEEAFETMMGKYIMGYVETFYIKNKVLYIKIKSPELKNELSMGKSKIKEHINNELDVDYLNDIKFL